MGVTLVTGASSGIGRSLARRLAAGGESVGLLARRADRLADLAREIEAAGGRALAVACDVTDAEAVRVAVRQVEARLGPVTRLVANAGGGEPSGVDPFLATPLVEIVRLNLFGVAYCIEAVLPGMLARREGHLVAMGSLAAARGLPGAAAYSAAKAALANLMESLRIDLRGRGVDVTLLAPGFVRTQPPGRRGAKRRPFALELEDATARMQRAIERRVAVDAFPWPLVALLAVTRWLPRGLTDRLLAGRGPKPR